MKKTNKNFGEISKHIIKNQHLIITKHLYKNEDIDLGEQNVFTPIFDIERMCNFVFISIADESENICVMYNLEILEYFFAMGLINKKYTFCYDSLNDYRFAKLLEKKYNNVKNSIDYIDIRNIVINGKQNNSKGIEKFMAKKHFDVIFTNPPYENHDLRLINEIINNNVTNKMIVVHPGTFLFGHNESKKFKFITEVKNSKMLKEVTFFWGNNMFDGTGVKHAHCITVWDKNHNSDMVIVHDKAFTERKEVYNTDEFTYTINVNDITIHSKVAEKAAEIMNKMMNEYKNNNLNTNQTKYVKPSDKNRQNWTEGKKYGFKFSSQRGGLDYNDSKQKARRNYGEYFSFFGTEKSFTDAFIDDSYVFDGKYEYTLLLFFFNTEAERTNFVNYLKLKCTRFLLSLLKNRKQLVDTYNPFFVSIIPWMDFTKHYIEEDLKKAWGIDDELWDYIDKFIPDYYEDYKEISK